MASRPLDVIVYGATGFTGKLACKYIKDNYPTLKWGIAGRDLLKLNQVKKEFKLDDNVPVFVADVNSSTDLDKMTSQTTAILTTTGPFAKYGSNVIRSCVKSSTHYCDITGETPWVRKVIDEFHREAVSKKIRLVNCCGFDSIPSDLGCQMIVDEMIKLGLQPLEVKLVVSSMIGNASGGTIASLLNILNEPTSTLVESSNPFCLNERVNSNQLDQTSDSSVITTASDSYSFAYDKIEKTWTMPFIMQGINTRIVNRSNNLLGFKYGGKNFVYTESFSCPGLIPAAIGTFAFWFAGLLLFFKWSREFVKYFLFQPGQGPSNLESGCFILSLYGKGKKADSATNEVSIVRGRIVALNGDPGYIQTSKMISESAICLALDQDKLPERYGCLTPSTAMGAVLRERLHSKGIEFFITSNDTKTF